VIATYLESLQTGAAPVVAPVAPAAPVLTPPAPVAPAAPVAAVPAPAASDGPLSWDEGAKTLRLALAEQRSADVDSALGALVDRAAGQRPHWPAVQQALRALKSHRQFAGMVRLGEASRLTESKEWTSRKLFAQALIDTDALDRAIAELRALKAQIEQQLERAADGAAAKEQRLVLRQELAEAVGLLGRSHKQRCVNASVAGQLDDARKEALEAINHYRQGYQAARVENMWHGINYVAVARYAMKALGAREPYPAPDAVAKELLDTYDKLKSEGRIESWDHATRAEALLALGRRDEAKAAYQDYLALPDIDRFMRGSTRRQLEQLWLVPKGDDLLALFGDEPGAVERPIEQLQARYARSHYTPPGQDVKALDRARLVARLGENAMMGDGTGFLFDGALLSSKLAGKPLLLGCAHVCPEEVKPQDLTVTFFGAFPNAPRKNIIVEYVELLWHSPSTELDASLLLLGSAPFGLSPAELATEPVKVDDVAYVISHPLGGAKLAALYDNQIRRVQEQRFFYTSATDPGSSGAPVFDRAWRLTGIHRAGVDAEKLNQATRLDVIMERLKQQPW
jgi:hypothetical protein